MNIRQYRIPSINPFTNLSFAPLSLSLSLDLNTKGKKKLGRKEEEENKTLRDWKRLARTNS